MFFDVTTDLHNDDLKKFYFIRSKRRKCLKFGKKGKYINKYIKPVYSHNNNYDKFYSFLLDTFETVSFLRFVSDFE